MSSTALERDACGSGGPPERLLVATKFRYLGDTIVATPALSALRAGAPRAHITLLSGTAVATLLQGCPDVDEIWTFDPMAPDRVRANVALIRRIRNGRFDAALLFNRSIHSAFVARAGAIRRRVGFDTEHRGPLLTVRVPYRWDRPERDCLADLVAAGGVAPPAPGELPRLWVTDEERDEARELIAPAGRSRGPLIAVQPGANDPYVREWGAERFAAVASRLATDLGARILVVGSAEERAVSERTAAAISPAPLLLAGGTSLRQALAVLSLCDLWIGNDGGMLHAAVALGAATVAIFGPTKAPRWGYDLPRHRTMVVYPDQPARDAATIRRCLDAVTVEEVLDASKAVLR